MSPLLFALADAALLAEWRMCRYMRNDWIHPGMNRDALRHWAWRMRTAALKLGRWRSLWGLL